MRSQVQVLAGPPPITPGQSAVGSRPRALAARLGRAGAACPSSPAPPGTPTRGVRHHDHHSPWSPPSPDGSHAAGAATSHRSLLPSPPASRQPPVLRTPAWPACSLSGHAPPYPTRPGSATNPTDHRDLAAPPVSRLAGPSTEPLNGAAAHRDSARPVVTGARRSDLGPTPPPGMGGDGRVRADGADTSRLDTARADSRRLDAGRVDTRGPDTGRVDSRRPDRRTPGRRTRGAGHRTAGNHTAEPPDPGRRTPMVDTRCGHRPATDAVAGVLAVSTRATRPDRWMSAGRFAGRRRLGE
jgi:hypothetical protein